MIDLLPRELAQYFDTPKLTAFILNPPPAIQLVKANPDRIGLIFCVTAGGAAALAPDSGVSTTHCYIINGIGGYLHLTHQEWGNLVQSEWWGVYGGQGLNPNVSVIETFLPRAPGRIY